MEKSMRKQSQKIMRKPNINLQRKNKMDNEQTLKQRKIALAQSEHAFTVIELIRDCIPQTPILGATEFQTLVNAITLDALSTLMRDVVDHIEGIRKGKLHDE